MEDNNEKILKSDYDPYENGVLPDLDTYEPTLHISLFMLVVGNLTEKGCYPDWALAENILNPQRRIKTRGPHSTHYWYFVLSTNYPILSIEN